MDKYQDFVIKNGVFIGKFEEMYQRFPNPWLQESEQHNVNSYSRNIAIINLRLFKIGSVVEFGCGLGYFTNLIFQNIQDIKIKGIDVSPTAINKAKYLWPHLDFEVDKVQNIEKYANYDAVLFGEIMWYILDDLDGIFKKMMRNFRGKYFLNNLVFYKGQQQYGNKFFTNLKEFIEFVPFKLLGYSEATTVNDDTIETSTIFKIEEK